VFAATASRLCRRPAVGFDRSPCPDADPDLGSNMGSNIHGSLGASPDGGLDTDLDAGLDLDADSGRAADRANDQVGGPGRPIDLPFHLVRVLDRPSRSQSYRSRYPTQLSTAVDNFLHILWITGRRPVDRDGRGEVSTMWNGSWTSHDHELPR
jgi:hypothetical protein